MSNLNSIEGKAMTPNKHLTTRCECSNPAHLMEFILFQDEKYAELYCSVQLNPFLGFQQRFYQGVRYILGKRSRFSGGYWDEGNISPESAQELIALCQEFLRRRQEQVEKR